MSRALEFLAEGTTGSKRCLGKLGVEGDTESISLLRLVTSSSLMPLGN